VEVELETGEHFMAKISQAEAARQLEDGGSVVCCAMFKCGWEVCFEEPNTYEDDEPALSVFGRRLTGTDISPAVGEDEARRLATKRGVDYYVLKFAVN
jgi:hypothetical protein